VVAFSGPQLAADADNIVATMGLRPDWPNLAVISMAHSYGFSNLVLPLLLHGIPLIILPSPLPETLRAASRLEWPLTLPGVPLLWKTWHETGVIPDNLRLAISAGAPLPASLEQSVFKANGLKIHNFYGSSECGGIAYDTSSTARMDESCVGAPMKNVSLAVNEEGCLQVRSHAVGIGYWPEGDPVLGGGVFQTSDLVELEEGLVHLRGRLGDQINVAGRKVSPSTIEAVLASHPAVRECLVFGVPSGDPSRTESIVACVVFRLTSTVEELRRHLLSKLPAWQVPRDWWFVESLEASHRGKLSRAEWRRRFMERPAAPDPVT
jgi:long-chain acyl-CoA synthetase